MWTLLLAIAVPFATQSGKPWHQIRDQKSAQWDSATYVPEGQTASEWTEQASIDEIRGVSISPRAFYDQLVGEIEKVVAPEGVQSTIDRENDHELIAHWRVQGAQAQQERVEIDKKGDTLVVIRNTSKKVMEK